MTPGPKFSSSTSAVFRSARKTSWPPACLRLRVRLRLLALKARKEERVRIRPVLLGVARDVAPARLLHLDHVRPQPGEHLAARGSRLIVREIDDANAGQGLAHRPHAYHSRPARSRHPATRPKPGPLDYGRTGGAISRHGDDSNGRRGELPPGGTLSGGRGRGHRPDPAPLPGGGGGGARGHGPVRGARL